MIGFSDVTAEEFSAEIKRIANGEPGWSQVTPILRHRTARPSAPPPFGRIPLTPTQLECLRVVSDFLRVNGCAPTFREIASALGIKSRGRVWHLLAALENKGWIQRSRHAHNGIKILAELPSVVVIA